MPHGQAMEPWSCGCSLTVTLCDTFIGSVVVVRDTEDEFSTSALWRD